MRKLFIGAFALSLFVMYNPTQTKAYDTSVFMPVATICPSLMQYYTVCEQWGMGCMPNECDKEIGG
ncbi:hypothetical protein [Algoriphagus sp.]|uniref:hypothetical protein n=1 Tax=Algoriphagus sp. TaxID=1872435 RepID=UPI00262E8A8A|nr:hypothetical protein [Algoriphagus sp.]